MRALFPFFLADGFSFVRGRRSLRAAALILPGEQWLSELTREMLSGEMDMLSGPGSAGLADFVVNLAQGPVLPGLFRADAIFADVATGATGAGVVDCSGVMVFDGLLLNIGQKRVSLPAFDLFMRLNCRSYNGLCRAQSLDLTAVRGTSVFIKRLGVCVAGLYRGGRLWRGEFSKLLQNQDLC